MEIKFPCCFPRFELASVVCLGFSFLFFFFPGTFLRVSRNAILSSGLEKQNLGFSNMKNLDHLGSFNNLLLELQKVLKIQISESSDSISYGSFLTTCCSSFILNSSSANFPNLKLTTCCSSFI